MKRGYTLGGGSKNKHGVNKSFVLNRGPRCRVLQRKSKNDDDEYFPRRLVDQETTDDDADHIAEADRDLSNNVCEIEDENGEVTVHKGKVPKVEERTASLLADRRWALPRARATFHLGYIIDKAVRFRLIFHNLDREPRC